MRVVKGLVDGGFLNLELVMVREKVELMAVVKPET